jgi:segregation and condensation protein B
MRKKDVDPKRILEALLFAASEPLSVARLECLVEGVERGEQSIPQLIDELNRDYQEEGKSFTIDKIANGYQLRSKKDYAPWIKKLFQPRRYLRLSRPTLETLAIIAYKQPITRAEIEAIRGVSIEGILKNLLERELIKISGQKEVVGRPYLYSTSHRFLEHFGLNSLSDLPPLEPRETPSSKKITHSGELDTVGRSGPPSVPAEVNEL